MYSPHFSHILYCVNQELERKFIHDWHISVVKISEEVGAVACLAVASQMQYNTKGTFHITETMLISAQHWLSTKMNSLVWMTGDFFAYKADVLTQCASKIINCQLMPKDLLVKISNRLSRMDSMKASARKDFLACLGKIEKDPHWFSEVETVWITDLAIYLPSRLYTSLNDLRMVFFSNLETMRYDFMTVLLIECEQLTVEYLHYSEQLSEASKVDYVYPFFFSKISVVDDLQKKFCEYFEQDQL
jgi:hypothetical protein